MCSVVSHNESRRVVHCQVCEALATPCMVQSSGGHHQRGRSLRTDDCSFLRQRLVFHASDLKLVRPLPRCSLMGMLEMLTEVVGAKEFLRLVALSVFVYVIQMLCANIPLRWVWKLLAAIATQVGPARRLGSMKSGLNACKNCAAPAMSAKMQ